MFIPVFPKELINAEFNKKTNTIKVSGPIVVGGSMNLPVNKLGAPILPGSVVDLRDDFLNEPKNEKNFFENKNLNQSKNKNSYLEKMGLKYKI